MSENISTINIVVNPTLERVIAGIQQALAEFSRSEMSEAKEIGCKIATSIALGIKGSTSVIEDALKDALKTDSTEGFDSVKAKAANTSTMQTDNPLLNIDEEQALDLITAKQLGRIIEFLLNIEED